MVNKLQNIVLFLKHEGIYFEEWVNLKTKTWIKRGGIARLWIHPKRTIELENLVVYLQLSEINFEIVGSTSNLYFLNSYNPEIVISTIGVNEIIINSDNITCACGVKTARLARICIRNGISGFEGLVGLPGTVGGAVVNNAGCYGSLISSNIQSVLIISDGERRILAKDQLGFKHRKTDIKLKKLNGIILSVVFNIMQFEDSSELKNRALEFQKHRKIYQESEYPNLGSIYSELHIKENNAHKIISSIVQNFLSILCINPVRIQKTRVILQLFFLGAWRIKDYISKYNINVFTWKDSGADMAFKEYVRIINKKSKCSVLEIEIKGNLD